MGNPADFGCTDIFDSEYLDFTKKPKAVSAKEKGVRFAFADSNSSTFK